VRIVIGATFCAGLVLCLIGGVVAASIAQHTLSAGARRSLTITLYQDFAVIHDERSVPLAAGENRAIFEDVSPRIAPETAFFTDASSSQPVWVDAVSYDTDVLGANALYQQSVGHTVVVITVDPKTGHEIGRQKATLLSTDGPVLQFRDRIENGVPPNAHIAYTTIPKGFVLKPVLVADFGTTAGSTQPLALHYVTDGFGWTTDYVCELSAQVDKLDVDAVATLTNTSGESFDDAHVRLVSGSVARITQPPVNYPKVIGRVMTTAAAADVFSTVNPNNQATHSALLEYYEYDVPKPVDLTNDQPVQVSLFTAEGVPVIESFETSIDESNGLIGATSDVAESPIEVYLQFVNQGRPLGIPLPEGVMHLYKRTPDGDEFIGESAIGATPKAATVRLDLGQSDDLKIKEQQTGYREVPRQPPDESITFHYSDWRVTLTNAKSKAVSVKLVEPMSGDWSIYHETITHTTLSPESVQWVIPVPASGSTTLDYSVLQRS
jgi:hypothetical protein